MAHDFALPSEHRPPLFRALVRRWRGILRDLFDPYRPELHYMRGPGPKWRERHPGAGAQA